MKIDEYGSDDAFSEKRLELRQQRPENPEMEQRNRFPGEAGGA
jgi:hypothetical protein